LEKNTSLAVSQRLYSLKIFIAFSNKNFSIAGRFKDSTARLEKRLYEGCILFQITALRTVSSQ